MKIISDSQKMPGKINERPAMQHIIVKLVERINLHELDASLTKDQFTSRLFEERRIGFIRPAVAIMKRRPKQRFAL